MCKRAVVALFAILLVALTGAPALAAPPLGVEFEVPTFIPPEGGPTFGPFVASGPAVDAGLMCETGRTIDISGTATGLQSNRGVNYHITKMFTCDDGSGDFVVKLEARVDWKGDNFHWTILSGSGAYERLHGTGSGVGLPIDIGVLDLYSGRLHSK